MAEKIEIDVSKALRDIAMFTDELKKSEAQAKKTEAAVNEVFEGDEDAKRAAASLKEYNESQEKVRLAGLARAKQQKTLQETSEALRKEQAALNKETTEGAKAMLEGAKAINKNADAMKDSEQATGKAGGALGALGRIVGGLLRILGPIGIAIGVVVAVFSRFQSGLDAVSKITASTSAVFNVLLKRVEILGNSILELFKGNFSEAGKIAKQAFSGVVDDVGGAAVAAFELEGRVQALRDAQLAAALSTAKLAAESEKLQAISEQEGKTFNERISALKAAIAIEGQIAKTRIGFAAEEAAIAREKFRTSLKNVADTEALLDKEIRFVEIRNEVDRNRIQLIGQLNQLEADRANFIVKNLEDVAKAITKIDLILTDDPLDAELTAIRQKTDERVKLAEDALKKLAEVEKLRPLGDSEIEQRQKIQDSIIGIIEKGTDAEIAAILESVKKINDAEQAAADERTADKRAALQQALDLQNQLISITEAEFDNLVAILRAGGAEEAEIKAAQLEFDKRIQSERLQALIDFQKGLLALEGNDVEKEIIRARIQELETLLDGIAIPEPAGGGIDLKKFLGLDDEQLEGVKQAIGTIVGLFQDLADARVQEAEAQVRAAEESTAAAQEYYDEQFRLNEEGFANDLDLAQRQLAAAKVQEDQALEQKKKAQRQQLLLEAALQAANLATAISATFKQFPGALTPIAIAITAIQVGAFLAAKAKALQATKFRDGGEGRVDGTGLIVGRSHAQGGVKFEAEGGEFMGTDGKRFGIVNKRMTAKHFDLLQAVNRDDKLQMKRIVDGMTAPMNRDNVLSASGGVVVIGGGMDNGTHKLLSDWRNESKNRETVAVAGGYLIRRRGNYTRKTKIA